MTPRPTPTPATVTPPSLPLDQRRGCRAGRRCLVAVRRASPPPACSALLLGWSVVGWRRRSRWCCSWSPCRSGRGVVENAPRGRGPAGHRAGLGGVRARAGAAGLADLDGGQQGRPGDQRRVPDLLDAQRRRRRAAASTTRIIGTLLITLAAAVISVPIGLLTAIYLVEYGKQLAARARRSPSWST